MHIFAYSCKRHGYLHIRMLRESRRTLRIQFYTGFCNRVLIDYGKSEVVVLVKEEITCFCCL